ncbi:hypothetical protein [Streptomyces sp. HNM0574]|uniref:hypothetical protein n=1 Tax=Streptomyces sp. HNM0574 TaxID=2714954 RepID=UPI00146D9280|nr:hypothetical protein [Streptomyces sp. HNM0574]NLU69996.1 hypothetical protein [Streptomyces sp. HNM0574]
MTQPPPPPPGQPPNQPPNQPPPGGFGGPQDPSAGGPSYGYPQQPGAPQPGSSPHSQPTQPGMPAQPGPPPQGGGYGYPQQGPPPGGAFGAPQQPGPPFGAPQAGPPGMYPGMPGPGFPGGPGKTGGGNSGAKVAAIIAVAVVLVVAVGIGGWLVLSGDDGGNTTATGGTSGTGTGGGGAEAEQLIDVKAPTVSEVTNVSGGWLVGDVFAKSSATEIVGTSVTDGSRAWTIPLKGGICAASQEKTDDGKVALVAKGSTASDANCDRLVLVDLTRHKVEWDKPLPNRPSRSNDNVTISGDTVATAWIGGAAGYRVSSGQQIWKAKDDAQCEDQGYAGGEELYAVVQCGHSFDSSQKYTVEKLDPATGKSQGRFQAPKGVQSVRVASTDPLVVVVGAGESTPTDVMTVGDDHKLKARISLGDRYNKPCGTEVQSCFGMAVGEDEVYLSTTEHAGSGEAGRRTNEIMAFDMDSGKTKWKSEAGEDRQIVPFTVEDGKVLGYKLPGYQQGGEIVSVTPGSGAQKTLLRMPKSEVGQGEQAFSLSTYSVRQPILFEDGKLFLQEKLVSEPRAGSQPKLAVGFGVK